MRRRLLGALGGLGATELGGCLRLDESDGTTTANGGTASSTRRTTTGAATTANDDVGDDASTEDDASDEPASYPVGIDDEGVYAYLIDNHVNTLVDTTFTENWTVVNRTRGETMESLTAAWTMGARSWNAASASTSRSSTTPTPATGARTSAEARRTGRIDAATRSSG